MKKPVFDIITTFAVFLALPSTSLADVENGQKAFKKQCVSCHVVVDDNGKKIAGRSAKTGPNLFGIVDRPAASQAGYRYSKALETASTDKMLVWNEANLVDWLLDPSGFLKSFSENDRARAKMSFKVRKPQDAADIVEYLKTAAQ